MQVCWISIYEKKMKDLNEREENKKMAVKVTVDPEVADKDKNCDGHISKE